jgi:hypothetical protein
LGDPIQQMADGIGRLRQKDVSRGRTTPRVADDADSDGAAATAADGSGRE